MIIFSVRVRNFEHLNPTQVCKKKLDDARKKVHRKTDFYIKKYFLDAAFLLHTFFFISIENEQINFE